MNRQSHHFADALLGRAALVSLAIGTATIGCTPSVHGDHVAALSDDAAAARALDKARAAFARHDDAGAIGWAERAVAARPADADRRLLLGQAYLAAGRFASAQASFRDTLTLAPDQSRARFDLALTQIAQGALSDARATLAAVRGRVPETDLGLALAFAGDRQVGIAMLTDRVRAGQSDARTRQNLALALALDGQWEQARGLAMQDTPPDRLSDKLAGWAVLAQQGAGASQVAAMIGTAPDATDPGRPNRLALAMPTVDAPVALALAAPAPIVPVAPSVPVAAVVPALLAAVPATAPAPAFAVPRLIRTAQSVPPHAAAPIAPGPLLRTARTGGYVVQLGAYARSGALDAAWSRASRLSPRVATFTPVQGSIAHRGATLLRLSIGGFGNRDEAAALCGQIRTQGGDCFVRTATGDRPWQWATRQDSSRDG